MSEHITKDEHLQFVGWQIKQWGVRFPYALGSFLFGVGSCFGLHEVLNES